MPVTFHFNKPILSSIHRRVWVCVCIRRRAGCEFWAKGSPAWLTNPARIKVEAWVTFFFFGSSSLEAAGECCVMLTLNLSTHKTFANKRTSLKRKVDSIQLRESVKGTISPAEVGEKGCFHRNKTHILVVSIYRLMSLNGLYFMLRGFY